MSCSERSETAKESDPSKKELSQEESKPALESETIPSESSLKSSSLDSPLDVCPKCLSPVGSEKLWAEFTDPPCRKHLNICAPCVTEELQRALDNRDVVTCPACEYPLTLITEDQLEALESTDEPTLQCLLRDFTIGTEYLNVHVMPKFAMGMGEPGDFRVQPEVLFFDFVAALLCLYQIAFIRSTQATVYQKKTPIEEKGSRQKDEGEDEDSFEKIPSETFKDNITIREAGIRDHAVLILDANPRSGKESYDETEEKFENVNPGW